MPSKKIELVAERGSKRKFRKINKQFVIHYRGPSKPALVILPKKNFRKQTPIPLTFIKNGKLKLALYDAMIHEIGPLKTMYHYNKHVATTDNKPIIVKIDLNV